MKTGDRNKKYSYSTKAIYFACALFLTYSHAASAQTQDIINQQDWITRNQQNILEEKKRDTEFETIEKERERKKKEEEEESKNLNH